MHVLILGGSPDHLGGVEAFCERSKRALQNRNPHHVTVMPTWTAYFRLGRLPKLLRGVINLARYKRFKPDCVWLQYVNLADLVYLLAAKFLGFTVLVTPHLGSNWRSQSNIYLRSLSGWLLSFADRIALISTTQTEEVNLPRTVPRSLIQNFLPQSIWAMELPDARVASAPELQLLHACRLSEGKGTFLVVEVCDRLRRLGVPFVANIAGGADAQTMKRLIAMIEDRNLQKHVKLLGRVSDDALHSLLRNADVLIHPSRIDSYPLIVLEAISYCTYPICVNLAGARDMVERYTGKTVTESNAVEEITNFIKLQTPAGFWEQSREVAPRLRRDYGWDACALAVEKALEKTISKNVDMCIGP